MALETPRHLEGISLRGNVLILHCTVARVAVESSINVNRVVKEDEFGKLIDFVPFDRRSGFVALADWLEKRRVGPNLRVTAHAGFSRRNACIAGLFDAGMAITTINPKPACMVFMAERNGLVANNPLVREIGRFLYAVSKPGYSGQNKNEPEDAGSGNCIECGMEELSHISSHNLGATPRD